MYDEILDAQAHYRELLDSMARPGKINTFPGVAIERPGTLPLGSVYVGRTLLGPGIPFALVGYEAESENYLRVNTGATNCEPEKADFLFAPGDLATLALRVAKLASLQYPEYSATLIVSLNGLSYDPLPGGLTLVLSGPGIETESTIHLVGVAPELFEDLRKKNAEYPLGVDIVFTCDTGSGGQSQVACLPRTTDVRWER